MGSRVEHVLALKLTRPFTDTEKYVMRKQLLEIDGVLSVSAGENYTSRGQGYNAGIVVRFSSKEAEAAYQSHPTHVAVRDNIIKPLLNTSAGPPLIVLDYAFVEPSRPSDYKGLVYGFAAGLLVAGAIARLRR